MFVFLQDSLVIFPTDRKPVLNLILDVGVYFDGFDGQRYIPNAETMAMYPDDEAVVLSLLGRSP